MSRVINESARVNPETRARVLAAIEALDFQPQRDRAEPLDRPLAGHRRDRAVLHDAIGRGAPPRRRRRPRAPRLRPAALRRRGPGAPRRRAARLRPARPPRRPDRHLPPAVGRRGRAARARRPARRAGRRRASAAAPRRDRRRRTAGDWPPSICSPRATGGSASSATWPRTRSASRRASAAAAATSSRSVPPAIEPSSTTSSSSARTGSTRPVPLAEALLGRDDPPTAIFAASDMQAVGVLRCARELGLRVPQDIAVIGFDDIDVADHPGADHGPATPVGQRRTRRGGAAARDRGRSPGAGPAARAARRRRAGDDLNACRFSSSP